MFDNMSKQTLSSIAADLRSHMPSDPTFLARVGQLLRELINAEVMGRPDDHPMEVKPEPVEASTEPGETQPDPALTDGETGEHWDPATPEPAPTGPQYDAPKPPPGVQTAPSLAADIHR